MKLIRQFLRFVYSHSARLFYGQGLGKRFPPLKSFNNFLRSTLINESSSRSIQVLGHKLYVDDHDSLSISIFGIYEPETTRIFQEALKPGDVVVDIGANLGWYTLLAARSVMPTGEVFAFEPDPVNYALLAKNVATNGYKNVILENRAVSDQNANFDLYLDETNMGGHTLYPLSEHPRRVNIQAVRLDDFFRDHAGSIDLIKMDIEGGEGKALLGMMGLLLIHPETQIITEFTPAGLEQSGMAPMQFLKTLKGNGFVIYELKETGGMNEIADITKFLESFSVNRTHTNLWCTPRG